MALEMLHTYSLIHDDLPAMDDDDLRRGFPTCHKQFDEATAIIAGDGLLTYAFEILSRPSTAANPAVRCYLIEMLANAAGAFNGMVAGQMLDLIGAAYSVKDNDKEDLIRHIEEMKTGRLLRYAVEAGAALGGADEEQTKALISYSRRTASPFRLPTTFWTLPAMREPWAKPCTRTKSKTSSLSSASTDWKTPGGSPPN